MPHHSKLCGGTTNLVIIIPKGAILGLDTRTTRSDNGRIVSEAQTKYEKLSKTPPMVATMTGNVVKCKETWQFLKKSVQKLEGPDPEPEPVTHVANLGLNYIRALPKQTAKFGFFIVGMQLERPKAFLLSLDDKCTLDEVPHYRTLGSGKTIAENAIKSKCKHLGRDIKNITKSEATIVAEYALLLAALGDFQTGGRLQVIHITALGVDVLSEKNVVDLYLQFFNELNSDNIKSVLVFYKLKVGETQLRSWLGRAGDIARNGHALTKLAGNYYVRRVKYEKDSSVGAALGMATDVPKPTELPFTRSQFGVKFFDVEENQANRIYIAKVDAEVLRGLVVDS